MNILSWALERLLLIKFIYFQKHRSLRIELSQKMQIIKAVLVSGRKDTEQNFPFLYNIV